ncbi:MAG: GxxExxY protein [bacterium]
MSLKYEDITEDIIGSAFEIYDIVGYGFLGKGYQKALQVELLRRGHAAELEHDIKVKYKGTAAIKSIKSNRDKSRFTRKFWKRRSGIQTFCLLKTVFHLKETRHA